VADAVLTATPEEVRVSFPILKTDRTPDGDLMVYGRVTDGTVDTDNQIVNPDWSGRALKSWLTSGGNLRVQHQAMRDPAGVGLEIDIDRDGDGAHWLKALVVEPVAQRLVEKGALRAFSVGIMRPKVIRHTKAIGGEIVDGEMGEVSLVDRPANRNCAFTLVKSDTSGEAQWVGELEGDADVISKMADAAPSPAVIAKMLNGRSEPETVPQPAQGVVPGGPFADPVAVRLNEAIQADKRDFSASQRASAADSGAAMSDGSFPVKNGEDLSNAIHLAGHGKDPAAARAHIKRRAAALGLSDKIPDSWKADGSDVDIAKGDLPSCQPCHGSGKQDGEKCSACGGSGMMKKSESEPGAAKADGTGASSACTTCNGSGKIRGGSLSCPDCGSHAKPDASSRMPGAKKASKPRPSPAAMADEGSGNGPDDGPADDDAEGREAGNKAGKPRKKNKSLACSGCGCAALKGAAFCRGCGAQFTGKGADPAAGTGSPATRRLPVHREPDGDQMEIFEESAGMTDGDEHGTYQEPSPTWAGKGGKGGDPAAGVTGMPGTKRKPSSPHHVEPPVPEWPDGEGGESGSAIMSSAGTEAAGAGGTSKAAEAPYTLARMHDAFCAAWPAQAALDEYPSLKSVADAVAVEEIQQAAVTAIGTGDFEAGAALAAVAAAGEVIKAAGAEELADARARLHKSFTDMYPSAHPSPGSVEPGMFQRGYITGGHASMSAEPAKPQPPAKIPQPARGASSFRRGELSAGHERPSPGSRKALTAIAGMQVMHDHIAGMYPDLCPMGTAVPPEPSEAVKTAVDPAAALEELAAKIRAGEITGEQARAHAASGTWMRKQDDAEPAPRMTATLVAKAAGKKKKKAGASLAGAVQASITKALGTLPTRDEIGDLIGGYQSQADAQATQIQQLQDLVAKLGSQPDPAQAPNRGIAVSSGIQASGGAGGAFPAERRSLVDEAAMQERDAKLKFARSLAQSGDPIQRELANAQISKLLMAP
jgi:hypothetical protein